MEAIKRALRLNGRIYNAFPGKASTCFSRIDVNFNYFDNSTHLERSSHFDEILKRLVDYKFLVQTRDIDWYSCEQLGACVYPNLSLNTL